MHRANLRTKLLLTFLLAGLFPVVGSLIGWWRSTQARADLGRLGQLQDLRNNLLARQVDHLNWLRAAGAFQGDESLTSLPVIKDGHKCAFGKWYDGPGTQDVTRLVPELTPLWRKLEAPHLELHATALQLEDLLQQGKTQRDAALRFYRTETSVASEQLVKQFAEIREHIEAAVRSHESGALRAAHQFEILALSSMGIVLLVAPALGWILAQRMDHKLRVVAEMVSRSGDRAASSAHRLTSTSQSLAQGASEQAASVEETSSSLRTVAATAETIGQCRIGSHRHDKHHQHYYAKFAGKHLEMTPANYLFADGETSTEDRTRLIVVAEEAGWGPPLISWPINCRVNVFSSTCSST